ncbi:pre-toxin TG domain-containing protein [Sphingomonas asaccharolytica]|uniref:pre-toxin TG domain-containing protein n=1 Tax=Sphingomonas asaccharolytica TaxID=40681 RepID=UPI00082C5784|nr:pre-toxin TG domain-containing protein [Sphingomonas asaccharolytica]
MVAIFTGLGAGAERGSGNVLGGAGLLGGSSLGRSAEQVLLNAATGNLMIQQKDEMLVGLGPDASVARTYNTLGDLSDENGDNWRQSTDRRIYGLTGTVNTAGSTVKRVSADGSEITYGWDTTKSAYVAKDGSGAYDTLTWNSGTSAWTWTDGSSQLTETYGQASGSQYLITKQTDTSGNAVTFSYVTGTSHLDKVTTADGSGTQYLQYSWSGNNITQITTSYTDLVTSTARTLTRTRYTYDGSNRLSTVTVDLTPNDNSVADGKVYTTTYTYVGATKMVATITETDGSSLTIGYDGSNRVHTLTQTVATGVTRVTTIDYYSGYSTVTDATGQVTRLDYDANDNLTKITAPAASAGLASQVTTFAYDGSGNVTSVVDPLGNTTSYSSFTANGVAQTITDPLGNVTTRTYGSKNELLTETVTGDDQAGSGQSHTTRYVYDANDRLAFSLTADGNVVEHRYVQAGEWQTLTYVGQVYNLSGLTSSQAPTLAQMTSWVSGLTDPTAVNQRQITYDARGNITNVIDYGKSTSPGSGATANGYSYTDYVYDQAGQLLSRRDYQHTAETFVYDGLGRVVASVDLQGSTTSVLFDDANAKTIVTLANGLTQTSTYNKAGDLIASTQSAAATVSANLKPDLTNASQWTTSNLNASATAIDGIAATKFQVSSTNGSLATGPFTVAAGDTLTWEVTVMGVTGSLSDMFGFNGSSSAWGDGTQATATILSGPGSITVQNASGPSQISGLSASTGTRVRITRTFNTAETVYGFFYVKAPNTGTTADGVVLSSPNIVKTTAATIGTNLKPDLSNAAQWALSNVVASSAGTIGGAPATKYVVQSAAGGGLNPTGIFAVGAGDTLTWEVTIQGVGTTLQDMLGFYGNGGLGNPASGWGDGSLMTATVLSGPGSITVQNQGPSTITGLSATTATRIRITRTFTAAENVFGSFYVKTSGAGAVAGDAVILASPNIVKTTAADPQITLAVSRYGYDQLGRLRIANDATQHNSYMIYDNAGRKVGDVDHYGQLTEYKYDASNRIIATIRYATALTSTQLTTLQNPTSSFDLATNRPADNAGDLWTFNVYDKDGQRVETIDGAGDATAYSYDASGKLTGTTAYANKLTATQIANLKASTSSTNLAPDLSNNTQWVKAGVTTSSAGTIGGAPATQFTTQTTGVGGGLTTGYYAVSAGDTLTWEVTLKGVGTTLQDMFGLYGNGGLGNPASGWGDGSLATATIVSGPGSITVQNGGPSFVTGLSTSTETRVRITRTFTAAENVYGFFYVKSSNGAADTAGDAVILASPSIYHSPTTAVTLPTADSAHDAASRIFYDKTGRIVGTLDGEGYLSTITYDAGGFKIAETAYANKPANGATASFATLAAGTSSSDRTTHYVYDNQGLLCFTVDAQNHVTEYVYPAQALADVVGKSRQTIQYAGTIGTTSAWTVTAVRAAINAVSGLATNASNRSSWAIYDAHENLAYSIDATGAVVGYKYDAMGHVIKTTRYATLRATTTLPNTSDMDSWVTAYASAANDRTTRNYYDARGDLTFTIDGEGYVTRYDYDAEDRQVGTVRWDTPVALASISDTTLVTDIPALVSGTYTAIATSYDMDGRVATTTDGVGAVTSYVYNANGTLSTKTEGYGTSDAVQTYYVYDAAGRVVSRYDAYGSSDVTQTQFTYDAFGQVTSVTDPVGNKSYTYYDRLGQVVATLDAENNATETSYNAFGEVTSVIRRGNPGSGTATTYNAPTPDTARDAVTKLYYDTLGRVARKVDADGYETDTAYTVMGDVASVSRYRTNLWPANLAAVTHVNSTITGTPAPNDTINGAPAYTVAVSAGGAPGAMTSAVTPVANGQSVTFSFWIKKGTVNFAAFGIKGSTNPPWGDSSDTAVVLSGSGTISQYSGLWSITGLDANQPTLVVVTRTFHADDNASIYLYAGTNTSTAVAGDSIVVADLQASVATTTKFTYDKAGRVLTTTDALNQTETYTLNAFGERQTATNAINTVATYNYDRRGLLKSQVVDSGSGGKAITSSFSYDAMGHQVLTTDALNNPSSIVYDRDGRVIQTIDALSNATFYTYDRRGNLVTVKDALNNITRRAYDKLDRLIYTVDPLGNVTQNSYDGDGRIIATRAYATPISLTNLPTAPSVSDIQPLVTSNSTADEQTRSVYDGIGRLRYTVDPGNFLTEYDYDARGNVIRRIAYTTAITPAATYTLSAIQTQINAMSSTAKAAARITRNIYSTGGKLTYTIDALGGVVAYTYDAFGNTVKEAHLLTTYTATDDPTDRAMATWVAANGSTNDRVTRAIYDQDGQLRFAIDAEQFVTQYTYDAIGDVRFTTRYADKFDGHVNAGVAYAAFTDSTTLAQALTNVAVTPSAAAAVTERQYDSAGRLYKTIDPIGMVTLLTLDKLGRAVSTEVASGTQDASVTTRTFDAVGHVTSVTRAAGQPEASTTTSRYDALGRLTGTLDGNGSLQLAALGANPTQAQIDNVYAIYGTTYGYDAAGNVVTTTVALDAGTSAVTTKTYDAFGNVVKLVDPRNNAGYFYYDALDRLVLQIDPEGYATATSYTASGKIDTVTRYAAKPTGTPTVTTRPTIVSTTGVNTGGDAASSFVYDKLDHVTDTTQIVDTNVADNILEHFHYNVFGDRDTATSKLGSLTTNVYDKRGLLVSETMQVDASTTITNTYAYDARGNKIRVTEAYGLPEQRTTTYEYSLANLVTKKTGDAVPVQNADNLTTTNKAVVESYQYDLRGNLIKVTDANNASSYTYYDDLDRKVAEINAVGTLTKRTFDASGNVKLQSIYATPITSPTLGGTAPDGTGAGAHRDTRLNYDRNNRLTSTLVMSVQYYEYVGGNYVYASTDITTFTSYDAAGNAITQTDGRGNVTYTYYNKLGQKTAQVDAANYLTTWDLDHNGNVKKETRFATQLTGVPGTSTAPAAPAASNDDRITTFLYDLAGRRVSESRLNLQASSLDANGALSTSSAASTITYSYNALGQVLQKTEANGDYTKQGYDLLGRVKHTEQNAFVDYRGVTVTPSTDMTYNGLDEVVTTTVHGDGTASAPDRITTNLYGAGGRLLRTTDATGFATSYFYDNAGNVVAQTYGRLKANGSTENDGVFITYDAAGRETSRKSGVLNGSWTYGDTTDEYYDAFGEVIARGTNSGGNIANAQEFAEYDNAGHVWRTNFNDGVTKAYAYDRSGNATMLLQGTGSVNLKSYANLNAIFADSGLNHPITRTISIFDQRNQLTGTIQPTSTNNGASPATATPNDTTGSAGSTYYNSSASVVSASNTVLTGAPASTLSSVSSATVSSSANVVLNWYESFWFSQGQDQSYGNYDNWDMSVPASSLKGSGAVHIFLNGSEIQVNIVKSSDGSLKISPLSGFEFPEVSGTVNQNFSVYQEVPETGGSLVLLASPQVAADFIYGAYQTKTLNATVSTPAALLLKNESANATAVRVFVRSNGSTGAYTELNATQLQNAAGQNVVGWFSLDLTQSPFNGLAANSSWDIKYLAMDAAGNIYDSKQGNLSVDASGNPSERFDPVAVGGPGQAMLTNGGGRDLLVLSGLPSNATRFLYRTAGSANAWTTIGIADAPFGQQGLKSVDVTGLGGPIEYWVELANGTKLNGTFTVGGQPSVLTQYADGSRAVQLNPPSGVTVTNQQFRYQQNGVWSQWFTHAGGGSWTYDASALADFYSDRSYQIQYETYNGSTLVSQGTGTLKLGYTGQSVSGFTNTVGTPAKVVFNPQQTNATSLQLYWRDKGTTGPFNASTVTKGSDGVFVWNIDADPAHPRPANGTRALEYYYDAYASDGSKLPPLNGDDHVQGTLTLGSDSYTNPQNREIFWSAPASTTTTTYSIYRAQNYNAFGEISSEVDGKSAITSLYYNTLGKLTKKVSPQVNVTDEAGNTSLQNPTETYYYDVSGRLIGKRDANSNLANGPIARATLLAGSGHGGADPLTLIQYNPDGTRKSFGYDVFGDLRTSTDELNAVTNNSYDKASRLIEVDHPMRVGGNSAGVQLKDYYGYDGLGQRITHTNSLYGASVVEKTDYDNKGRVTATTDFAGRTTSYSYNWVTIASGLIATSGLGNFGGWQTITTNVAGLTSYENDDIFGHVTWRQDFGGHTFGYGYDLAGHLVQQTGSTGQSVSYTYYTNGYISSITDNALKMKSTFEYDSEGNRTLETYNSTDAAPRFYQNATVSYDALGRVKEFKDAKADISYKYDANGNRREVKSVYNDGVGGGLQTQDYWYKYDSMDRFTLTMGALSGGVITTGAVGVAIGYDAAGNRQTASYGGHTDVYSYTTDGFLENTTIDGVLRAKRTNDTLGRVTAYNQYTASSANDLSRSMTYDRANRVTDETDVDYTNGNVTTTLHNDYRLYVAGSGYSGADQGALTHTQAVKQGVTTQTDYSYQWWDDAKQIGIVIGATNPANPNTGQWGKGYTQLSYDVNGHLAQAIDNAGNRVMTYQNDAYGQVLVREEKLGTTLGPRQLYYYFDGHRIGDVGNNGPAPSLTDYAQALAVDRNAAPSKNGFRYGKPVASADFDQNFQPINGSYPDQSGTTYTVRTGDTLQTIAQTAWGDSSLWYLIADANGLTASTSLVAGQTLQIPNKVTNFHNNANTYRVYNPGEAIGDTLPTLPPQPAPPAAASKGGCGAFGQILMLVVAVAVIAVLHAPVTNFLTGVFTGATGSAGAIAAAGAAAITAGTAKGAIAAGAIVGGIVVGAASSLASQVFGVATGIQDKLNWKGVALAAIGGGVSAGIGAGGLFGKAGLAGSLGVGSKVLQAGLNGAVGSAVSQGIGVATGLQSKFDWTGVAAAGIGAVASNSIPLGGFGGMVLRNTTDGIAQAATRSAIQGTDFGDNVLASLPSVIANTIGGFVADRIAASGQLTERAKALAATIDPTILDDPQRFASFRSDYKTTVKLIERQAGGDSSSVIARRIAESEGRLLAAAPDAAPQPSIQPGSGEPSDIVIKADRILMSFMDQMDTATKDRFTAWDIKLQADRDAYEDSHPGYTREILPTERATALDYLIKAPFLRAGSFVYDNVPLVGTAKTATQLYTGRDVITGEHINRWVEGGALALSLIPFGKAAGKAVFGIGERALGRTAEKTALLSSAAEVPVVSTGRALQVSIRPQINLNPADFTPEEVAWINYKYQIAEVRAISGAEVSEVGAGVPYSYRLSQKFARDTLVPGQTISSVRIGDVAPGMNVDEFVSRQWGGRQVLENQNLAPSRPNQLMGPLEFNAAKGLPVGTKLDGFYVNWRAR